MAKTVSINLKIDTKDGVTNIDALNNEMNTTLTTMREMVDAAEAIKEELMNTEIGTEAYEKLSEELIKVNTALKNQELALEALDHEQVASEIKSVVGGLTDMAGGLALVGVAGGNLEKVAQTFAKVEGVSKLVTGSMEAYQSMMKLTGTITNVLATAQTALSAATLGTGVAAKVAAVGMRILNAVIAVNPIFLLVGAIAAVVAGLAMFTSSTEDASFSAKKMNEQLELQKAWVDKLINSWKMHSAYFAASAEIETKMITDVLKAEIDALETVEYKTEEQRGRLEALTNKLRDVEIENSKKILNAKIFDLSVEEGHTKKKLADTQVALDKSFRDTVLARERGDSAEIQASKEKSEKLKTERDQLVNQLTSIEDRRKLNYEQLAADEIVVATKATAEIIKQREIEAKAFRESRAKLLNELNTIYARQEKAEGGIIQARIEQLDELEEKELQLIDLTYGNQRDELISGAIKREITAIEEKFTRGLISQEAFESQRLEIINNGEKNLLDVEKQYLAERDKIRLREKQSIIDRYEFERTHSKEQTEEVLTNIKLANIRHQKEMAMLDAGTISDEKTRNQRILDINKQYLAMEVQAIRDSAKESQDVMDSQYKRDIKGLDANSEAKKLIDAKYYAAKEELANDTELAIRRLETETLNASTANMSQRIATWAEENQILIQFITDSTLQALSLIDQMIEESNSRAASARETKYKEDMEAYTAMLTNKTISEEAYNQRVIELNQQRDAEELQAKRKAFKQSKALQISNAVMQTATAVLAAFSSAAAVPLAGVALGPIMAGVAGALGATQIGIIASQQFRAAKGGVVPGKKSAVDSVNALLAPGEMVINSQSAAMFPQLLSTINQAGGGIPLAPSQITDGGNGRQSTFSENNNNQPLQAYVVESQMSRVQKRVSRIERNSEY